MTHSVGGRVTLLTLRTRSGVTTETIATDEGLLAALERHFGLRFPAGTKFTW